VENKSIENRGDKAIKKVVQLKAVSKHFGLVVALKQLDLDINKGEFLTLLGPSGSGKSTILNLIAGIAEPTEGTVWINGQNAMNIPANKRSLGMVFQNYALMPHMTVFDNIAFPLRIRKLSKDEIKSKVTQALETVQLSTMGRRKPNELSGGQQQRVSLARCLVYDPSIILMDEPLGALDKKLREQMQLEIKRLHLSLNITILYVTHDQEEALSMSDRIALMRNGQIEQIGPPSDLYFHPISLFTANFLGDSNIFRANVIKKEKMTILKSKDGNIFHSTDIYSGEVGDEACILVRPENVQFREGKVKNQSFNELQGTVSSTIFIAGVTNTYIKLANDLTVVVKTLTTKEEVIKKAGTKVALSWPASYCRVLNTDAAMSKFY